jgi:hypothetical protein
MKLTACGLLVVVMVAMFAVVAMPANATISGFLDVTLTGGYVISEVGGHTEDPFADTLVVTVPSGATVTHAYLYLSFFALLASGQRSVEFAGTSLGDPYDALIETTVALSTARYDVASIVTDSGSYSLTTSATSIWGGSFYGATLLTIYSHPADPLTRIMVQDGAETVINMTDSQGNPQSPYLVSFTGISTASALSATLTVMVQGGEVDGTAPVPEDDQLRVNGVVIDEDAFHGEDGDLWDVTSWDVYSLLANSVDVEFDELAPEVGGWHNGYGVDLVILAVTYPITIDVDIKPCSWPNPLTFKDRGVLPVAIYGTDYFDVTMVDPVTVQLTLDGVGVAPLRWSYEDLNEDGVLDVAFKFKTQEVITLLGLDAFGDGDVVTLNLTGSLKAEFGNTPIRGQDAVWILDK